MLFGAHSIVIAQSGIFDFVADKRSALSDLYVCLVHVVHKIVVTSH